MKFQPNPPIPVEKQEQILRLRMKVRGGRPLSVRLIANEVGVHHRTVQRYLRCAKRKYGASKNSQNPPTESAPAVITDLGSLGLRPDSFCSESFLTDLAIFGAVADGIDNADEVARATGLTYITAYRRLEAMVEAGRLNCRKAGLGANGHTLNIYTVAESERDEFRQAAESELRRLAEKHASNPAAYQAVIEAARVVQALR